MKTLFAVLLLIGLSCAGFSQVPAPTAPSASDDVSGMYTFLQDGEFVQINIEDGSRVTGFISRYGNSDADKGEFLDQMFTEGELKGTHIRFKTKIVHGVSYEFSGTAERGTAKSTAEEGYRVLQGKLTEYTEDANHKTTKKSREVTLKSFPADVTGDQPPKD